MRKESSASKIKLNSFNDLFGMNDSMTEAGDVRNIMLNELFEFEGHPFKVRDDEKMEELTASIKDHGVLVPGIARIRAKGGYEIIAGHSRKKACENAGLSVMPMFIRNMSDDEATIVMVDSNLQREDILPSEKAKAYKMKYDAIKHQGKKGDSLKLMVGESGESRKVIQRYIKLADLIPELLVMVDYKKIGFTQGVDISFLTKKEQGWILKPLREHGVKISIRQSDMLKKASQSRELTESGVLELLTPEVVKEKPRKVMLKDGELDKFFSENYSEADIKEIIFSLLERWKSEGE